MPSTLAPHLHRCCCRATEASPDDVMEASLDAINHGSIYIDNDMLPRRRAHTCCRPWAATCLKWS